MQDALVNAEGVWRRVEETLQNSRGRWALAQGEEEREESRKLQHTITDQCSKIERLESQLHDLESQSRDAEHSNRRAVTAVMGEMAWRNQEEQVQIARREREQSSS